MKKLQEKMIQIITANAWDNGGSWCFYHEDSSSSEGELKDAAGGCALFAGQLAIQYMNWCFGQTNEQEDLDGAFADMSDNDLFNYWMNNIYKL